MSGRLTIQHAGFQLDSKTARKLRASLDTFCQSAEARYVALLEDSGTILTDFGNCPPNHLEIGALANGAFFAVQEVARRLGESSCEGLFHQGHGVHFYICPLSANCLLLTVFGQESRLGIIRSALAQWAPALQDLLQSAAAATSSPYESGPGTEPQEGDLMLDAQFILPREAPIS